VRYGIGSCYAQLGDGICLSTSSDDAICCHDFSLEKQPEKKLAFVLHLQFPDPGPSEVRVGSPKLNCIR